MTPPPPGPNHPVESVLKTISDTEFGELTKLIRERTGIFLPPGKKALLAARLLDRIHALGLRSFAEYHKCLLEEGSPELSRMIDAVATNETRFFRDVEQLEYIEEHLLPGFVAARSASETPRRIRVWSAGCSTGEEPYSVAMMLLSRLLPDRVEIWGTDISTTALDRARAARFPEARLAEVPETFRRRFFVRDPKSGEYDLTATIRSAVHFQRLNLCDWPYPVTGKFDLILCRNVLFYFDAETRAKVARHLAERLSSKGALVLGMAESLLAIRDKALGMEGAEQKLSPGLPPLKMVGPAVYTFAKPSRKKF